MLDIKLIRENSKLVKESLKNRGNPAFISNLDSLIEKDKKWREIKGEADSLRAERNKVKSDILDAKSDAKKKAASIKRAKEIQKRLDDIAEQEKILEQETQELLRNIPNLIDKSVPVGDPSHNKILKEYGTIKKPAFKLRGHEELLKELDLIDLEKAAEVAGARFYYLKGDLVKLNYSIINLALDYLRSKGFTLIQPPYMLNRKALSGAITLAAFEEMIYKIQDEDLYLIGTAEHALNAYYINELIPAEKLPIKFAGISPCFRKEAGAHGKDTKGIFRVHQFEKVEQFVFCKPEDSWKEFDSILNNTVEIFKALEIPFRTVVLASGDTGMVASKTIDVEGWFPVQNGYRELGSCSNCLDFQARRSNIKYEEKGERKVLYTLNNTAVALERALVCLVENHQQKDGSIKIPKALQKYTGFSEIKAVKKK
jgi:seryl-tRNA synthetase